MSPMCIFQNELVPKLSDVNENAMDTDTRVLDAYINQCTAEAQEGRYMSKYLKISPKFGH